ncbi:MAG: (2Fe-2S)-binding protein [Gemmatimonadota bacterium]
MESRELDRAGPEGKRTAPEGKQTAPERERNGPELETSFVLNGQEVTVRVAPGERLLDLLRYRIGLTGAKEGCAEGECGACTVWVDGLPADSCLIPAYQVRGASVETIESVEPEELEPFLAGGATQCGACTPGVVMTARWILRNPELLATHSVRELMAGNLCRCTGYDGIIESIEAALGARQADLDASSRGPDDGPGRPSSRGPGGGPGAPSGTRAESR